MTVHLVRRAALGALLVCLACLLWLGFVWPPPSWWRTHWPSETAFMALRAAQLRAAGEAIPRRYHPVDSAAISPWLRRAAVASEDEAFYQHHGVDYRAVREALGYRRPTFSWTDAGDRAELWRAVRWAWRHRGRIRGASTITQQLARNLYLSPSRNPLRKLKEAAIAYRLEWALSKARILDLYLNVAEFGPNLWGVDAASRQYFHQPPGRLALAQAALLIATLPHPLTSNPAFRPGRTVWRQQLILLKLGGAPVTIPFEASEDTLPAPAVLQLDTTAIAVPPLPRIPADSSGGSRAAPGRGGNDTAAAPAPSPDSAAASRSAAPASPATPPR